jgi:hypothetical protein
MNHQIVAKKTTIDHNGPFCYNVVTVNYLGAQYVPVNNSANQRSNHVWRFLE